MAKRVVLPGKRYGRLEVLGPAEKKYFVTCRCDCGAIKNVHVSALTRKSHPVKSCGCLRRETTKKTGESLGIIRSMKPSIRNTSGQKGVCMNKQTGKYTAYINAEGKRFFLGHFGTFEEAVAARKEGEKKYHLPLIEKFKKENFNA